MHGRASYPTGPAKANAMPPFQTLFAAMDAGVRCILK
jgi:hypothetical protein